MHTMQRFALTGGIASGKSSVARILARCGTPIVDADALYHALIAPQGGRPSPLTKEIAAAFPGTVDDHGAINRRALAAQVFTRPQDKQRLEAITHPVVAQKAEEALALLAKAGHPLAIYDIPLLFERNLAHRYDGVLLVWVPKEVQLTRLRARDGLSEAEANARIAAQASLDDKRARADVVFDNSTTQEALELQVRSWHKRALAQSRNGSPSA